MFKSSMIFFALCFLFLLPLELLSLDRLKKIIPVSAKKNAIYLEEVTFHNRYFGESVYSLENIRWAKQAGFERIVFDLHSASKEKKLPYFQINANPIMKRITVEIKNIKKIQSKIKKEENWKKSTQIKSIHFFPQMKRHLLSIEIKLHAIALLEVFYLTDPKRIILDIQKKRD